MRHSPVQILLVENNEDGYLIVKDLLSDIEETTYQIDWVSNYDEAKQRIHPHRYDIFLFDYRLGRNTGLDLVRYVRTIQPSSPCILLAGQDDHYVDVLAGETRAVDYLLKRELTPSGLERSIRHALERQHAEIEREFLTGQLMETSRRLGMAEAAATVLHNVGNVLNSLNVSATHLSKLVQESCLDDIGRITRMVQTHQQDLAAFFTQDSQGKHIAPYLTKLGEHLKDQRTAMLEEIQALTHNLDHIKHIIRVQQTNTTSANHVEPVVVSELMEQALIINLSLLSQHDVTIFRDYADIPPIMSDKHQVIQIVVNLIRNATQAMTEKPGESPRLNLTIDRSQDGNRIQLSVRDTGVGINPDHLTQIFSQGFTTKQEGRGLGLYSSALAATSLQGSLHAFSDGKGQGARFTLDLPFTPVKIHASSYESQRTVRDIQKTSP